MVNQLMKHFDIFFINKPAAICSFAKPSIEACLPMSSVFGIIYFCKTIIQSVLIRSSLGTFIKCFIISEPK